MTYKERFKTERAADFKKAETLHRAVGIIIEVMIIAGLFLAMLGVACIDGMTYLGALMLVFGMAGMGLGYLACRVVEIITD